MANGGRIDYTIGFKVDQSGLNQIKANLTSIQQGSTKDFVGLKGLQDADKKLIEIKKTASDVEAALNRSFNSNLGTLNISKFNQELKKLDIKKISADFSQLGPIGQNAFRNITSQILTTNLQLKQTNKWLDEMATTMTNSIKWGITSSIWNNMTGAIEKAWGFAKKLDSSLNDIRIVTDKSAEDMEKFAIQANKAARALGASTTGYTDASLIYYQQGLSDAEVQARTETTLKAANVTGQSAAEVSEQLTAVWNGYKVSAQETELYVDKLSAVAATTAANLEELSTGMSKVASAANIMGVDIDQLNAQLATVISVTRQAPESVGTAFKTIYARMGDIEAGLDTETSLGEYTKKMNEMGFNVLDTNGKLRDMGSIIEEIGNKWANLSREQQVALSQTMAGTRQYNNLLALFDNWNMYSKSIETSKNSTSALQKQQDTYMEGTKAHLQQLQTAAEGVYDALFNTKEINPIIDALTGVTNLFKNFINAIGGAQGALLLLGNIATKIFSKQIASSLATMITNFHSARTNIQQLKAEMDILSQFENTSLNDETGRTQHLIAMKREQLQLEKSLTEEERNISNEIIRQTNEIYKQQDAFEQKIQEAQTNYYDETGSTIDLKTTQGQAIAKQELEANVQEYQKYRDELQQNRNELRRLQDANESTRISQGNLTQTWEKATTSANGLIAQIERLTAEGRFEAEQQRELTQACNSFTLALDAAGEEGLQNVKVQQELQNVIKIYNQALNEAIQKGQKSIKTINNMNAELESQRNAVLAAEQSWKNFKSAADLKKQMSNLVSMTQGVGQLAMAFSSINNVSSILDNESLDDGEKLLQILMTTSMVLPSLLSGLTSLNTALGFEATLFDVIGGKIDAYKAKKVANLALEQAEISAKKINNRVTQESLLNFASLLGVRELNIASLTKEQAMEQIVNAAKVKNISLTNEQIDAIYAAIFAKQAETVATNTATAANNAFNASLLANPWTWVVLAIAAVVAGIAIYTNAVHEANKAQIKEHQTAIDDLKAKRQEIEENKNLVKSYKELKNAFDQGKYTKQEMYDKTLELCSAYSDEINMLDLLEGRYDNVGEAIKRARLAEIEELSENSDEVMQHYQDMLIPYKTENAQMGTKGFDLLDTTLDTLSFASLPGFISGMIQEANTATDNTKSNFSKIQEGQTTLTLNAGYSGQDESEVLSYLTGSSVFQGLDHKITGLFQTAYELGVTSDTSTPEEFAATYREIEQVYRDMSESLEEETKQQSETYHALYEWLENNKEYVENVEKEQRIKTETKAEKTLYELDFDEAGMTFADYQKKRDELYFETLYSKEVSKEAAEESGDYREKDGKYYTMYDGATRKDVDKIVNQKLKEGTISGEQWLAQDQLYNNLVERFGEDQSNAISAIMSNMDSADFQALLTLNIDEVESLKQLGIYIERAQYLVDRNKIQIGFEITQTSLDALMEGKELTKEQIEDLEAQFPELSAILDKNSRAYLETLQQIREEQESALSDTYIKERAFNWEQLNNAIKDYEEDFEDFENREFPTRSINSAGDYQQYQKDKENYIKLDKIEDLRQLKEDFENFFTSEYEFQISVTDDILTDIDNVISKAESAQKAISMIGDGFKLSAKDSKELFEIFPELAQDAEVLADGTLQLNQQVVTNVLKGYGLEIDADKEKTILAIQNRIAELEAHRDELQRKLEYVKETAAAEIDYNEIIGGNQEQWATYESQLSEDTSENQIKNSAASATAMIEHWAAVEQAAIDYAKTAADAAKGEVTGPRISANNYKIKTEIETSTDVTGVEETTQSVEAEAEKRKQELINFLQNLIDSDTEQIANLTSGLGMMLSDITEIGAINSEQIDLLDDIIDRYHDINILLDDMAKKIERVNRAQEHLVGADWLAAQEQGLKLLEEEIELRRQKQEIQQAEAVELQGHLLADGVKFFDDGSVANYAEIMIAQLAKVNQAKMSGNEDIADAAEKNYEAFKENFERYEELRDEIEDLADEITDMMYKQISKKVEAFTTKLTVELDTTQAQKEWKEFTNQLFISANNALAQITAQSEIYSANRNIATQTTGKYEQIVNEGIKAQSLVEGTAEEGTTSVYAQWSEELQQYIFDQAKWQEDMQASQQEAQEAILQILDDVDALGGTAIGLLEDTIAAQKEQLAIYDDMNSLLNHSLKLQELFTGENDYDAKGRIYAEQATISDQKARDAAARRNYALSNIDTYAQAYNEAKQKYDEAVTNGTGDVTVLEKQLEITQQAYEDMKNELKESTDDFYSSIEEQIEAAKNVYVNTINKAMADMEKMFTGGKGLSYINEEWDLINKNAERYLDTVNSTYEVQALESKYIKAMDSTSNLSAQKKINKAMEEELKALREKDKLSQYDIDRANKKYELTMKQIALEEAQANKSTMRLRRDAQGNYSYQFVADEDEVSDAQQDLLAAQNDLYNFDKDRYQQTQDDILSIYQEYQQKMLEAAQINDPTERAEKEKLITEQYQQLLLSIAADNETARQNLGMSTTEALQGQYDINRSNFEAMTQGIFDNFSSVAEGMSTNFEMIMSNMITGWSGGVQSMIDKIAGDGPDGFKQQSQNAFNIAQQAAQEFDNKLTEIGENFSGEGNTADRILSDVQEINDKLDSFKTNVLDPTLAAVQTLIPDVWAEYKSGVDLAAESMNTLATRISSVYTNADSLSKKLTNIASQSPINVEVKYKTTGDATNPSGGYTPNGGGEGGKISSQTSSQIGDTVVWGGDYGLLNQDVNNGNKMTNTSKTWNDIWDALDENERYDWDDAHWDGGDDEVLAYAFPKWKITQEIYKDDKVYLYLESERDSSIGGWIPEEDLEEFSKSSEGWSYRTQSFDTGGYTGEWGSEGRMAMLHEKEIVLNQTDTANILDAVAIVRGIGDMLASLQSNWLSNLSSVQVPTISNSETNNSTAQTVNITADFPNASSATEIEKALKNLVNIASQRAQAFK